MEKFAQFPITDDQAREAWENTCYSKNIPCVFVMTRKNGTADVRWDSGNYYDEAVQTVLDENKETLMEKFKEIRWTYDNPKSGAEYGTSAFLASFIHIDAAPKMAEDVFDAVHAVLQNRQ